MAEHATKDDIAAAMEAWDSFKSTNDQRLAQLESKIGGADPVTVEKLGKIELALDTAENANQKLTQELQRDRLKVDEAIATLEAKLNRPGQHGDILLSRAERKAQTMAGADAWARAVDAQIKLGAQNMNADQLKLVTDAAETYKAMYQGKALNLTDDTGGGYLAPVEFVAEILKSVVLISPVRALAKIRTTAMKSMHIPRRTALLAAQWDDELDSATVATGLKYGTLEVFTHGLRAIVDITNDMLEDAAFDMAAEINDEVSEQFAVSEGAAFVTGASPGQPEGFLVNAATIASGNVTKTGNATQLTADGFIQCYHNLKTAYARNAVWAMNRQTVGSARQLKDAVGQYLFMMGLPNGAPNTFLGSPYVEVPDMPAVGAGTYPVAFGDFAKGYSLVDRLGMVMIRDPYTQAPANAVRYLFRRRLGGKVTMAEAIQPLFVST